MMYLLQSIVTFFAVFLKGFQQQNVIGGYIRSAIGFSFLMACFDVAVIALVVDNGMWSVIPVGIGASFGIATSMVVFKKIRGVNKD